MACFFYLPAHTVLEFSTAGLRQWPEWAIKVLSKDATVFEDVKRHLAPGVWLDGYRAGRGFLAHSSSLS